jgi:hypothetical protein
MRPDSGPVHSSEMKMDNTSENKLDNWSFYTTPQITEEKKTLVPERYIL